MLTKRQLTQYAAKAAAMTDSEFETEVMVVTNLAAHCPVFCTDDQRATALYNVGQNRSAGALLYRRGHARMVAAVRMDRLARRCAEQIAGMA